MQNLFKDIFVFIHRFSNTTENLGINHINKNNVLDSILLCQKCNSRSEDFAKNLKNPESIIKLMKNSSRKLLSVVTDKRNAQNLIVEGICAKQIENKIPARLKPLNQYKWVKGNYISVINLGVDMKDLHTNVIFVLKCFFKIDKTMYRVLFNLLSHKGKSKNSSLNEARKYSILLDIIINIQLRFIAMILNNQKIKFNISGDKLELISDNESKHIANISVIDDILKYAGLKKIKCMVHNLNGEVLRLHHNSNNSKKFFKRISLPYIADIIPSLKQTDIDYAWEQILKGDGSYMQSRLGWDEFYKGKKSPGVDGKTVMDAHKDYLKNPNELLKSIHNGTYKPSPVKCVEVIKPNGGIRPLGIPICLDRMVQRAVLNRLDPKIDPFFSEQSFGFRKKRSTGQAALKAYEYIKQGSTYIVSCDLSQCFDQVPHRQLLELLSSIISDKKLIDLIEKILKADIKKKGKLEKSIAGVPQGGVISGLLANIYLHSFDMWCKERGYQQIRYADDFLIFVKSTKAARRIMKQIKLKIKSLGLTVNEDKSDIYLFNKLEYLGFKFQNNIGVSNKKFENFKAGIVDKCRENNPFGYDIRIKKIRHQINGFISYYKCVGDADCVKGICIWLNKLLHHYKKSKHLYKNNFAIDIKCIWKQSCSRKDSKGNYIYPIWNKYKDTYKY